MSSARTPRLRYRSAQDEMNYDRSQKTCQTLWPENRVARRGFRSPARRIRGLAPPNGAGKTTFLRILASLSSPSMGQVTIAGYNLPKQAAAVRARLGVVSHLPLLYNDLTAEENLLFYARMYGIRNSEERITEVKTSSGRKTPPRSGAHLLTRHATATGNQPRCAAQPGCDALRWPIHRS